MFSAIIPEITEFAEILNIHSLCIVNNAEIFSKKLRMCELCGFLLRQSHLTYAYCLFE